MKKNPIIITHSGSFHSDDVFAVATLMLSLPKDVTPIIIRTRDSAIISTGDFVVDVGGKYDPENNLFDHHQSGGAGKHSNGIPYASFGLVWKKFGEQISLSKEIADMIDEKLVLFIDALDNGVNISESLFEDFRPYSISDYLYSYWIDERVTEEEVDKIFYKVVILAKELLTREIEKAKRIIEESAIVESIYEKTEDKRLIILDSYLAWGKAMSKKTEPLFVVFPSLDGSKWTVKSVRDSINSFETRKLLPAKWAGKINEDLAKVTGVSDSVFCHNGRFIAISKSKEGAIALAKIALES